MLRRLFVSWWIRRLESRSWNVRLIACLVLGKIGDERAIEPLIDRLGDRDKDVRKAACEALEKLGEGRLARAVFGALKGKEEARKELAKLAKEGDYRAVKPLIEGLRYGSICSAACEALNAIFKTLSPLKEQMLCSKDLTRFEEKIAKGEGIKAKYLACRVCGKISEIILGVKEVVAVLDEGMREETKLSDGVLRVNWLLRQCMFDFDGVEIVKASPYEVEKFCIQFGNDEDIYRQSRRGRVKCVVYESSGLPNETINTLRSVFRKVEIRR